MRYAIIMAVAITLSGCFPAAIRALPGSRIFITDAQGNPVENAKLTLITYQDFLQRVVPTTPDTFYSNKKGIIKLPSKRDWVIQVPLPDAYRFYGWSFCISKDGYHATPGHISPGADVPQVVLSSSNRASMCNVLELEGRRRFEVAEVP